ncbi:MAG: hypothetical protein FJ290_06715 [Planctomycetes bacterium]|nr:hypothetical protein [Planctomycetota bacterium]
MNVFDLFSKRQRKLRGEVPDVYTYDVMPEPLRVQIVHVWHDLIGNPVEYQQGRQGVRDAYGFIVKCLCREYGVFVLPHYRGRVGQDYLEELTVFLLSEENVERVLDVVELSFRWIDHVERENEDRHRGSASKRANDAIRELNARFREHGVGYQFLDGQIVRVDSDLVHAEVVRPALGLLRGMQFAGAQEEFLKAHEHYRKGNGKEALVECLKAFESTMKAICDKRGWKYDPGATSKDLTKVCFDKGLIPDFWQSHFSGLRSTLESGVPTARNKLAGHGQGSTPTDVPGHIVAFVLHMTASAIVFLAEADRQLK